MVPPHGLTEGPGAPPPAVLPTLIPLPPPPAPNQTLAGQTAEKGDISFECF